MNRQAMLQEVRFLHPDVALLVGSYVSNGVSAPGGREIPPTPGVYDWVVVRRNGHWLITLWREANRPAPAPPRP